VSVRAVVTTCVAASLLALATVALAGQPANVAANDQQYGVYDRIKHPCEWLCIGGDERLRHTYLKNPFDFENNGRDNRNFFRIRTRLWAKAGPFYRDDALEVPNGLSLYTRFTYEPRYVTQWNGHVNQPLWDEVIVDNLWAEWARPAGMPFSIKVGRQDLFYGDLRKGRGLVLVDPSVFEGSRTLYSDGIKGTIHFDGIKGTLDLIALHNRADQHRLTPFSDDENTVSEYNQTIYAAYFRSKAFDGHEFGAYYIYKDEDPDGTAQRGQLARGRAPFNGRMVHTVGIPLMGQLDENWDYYVEGAYQWGTEVVHYIESPTDHKRRQSYAFTSDLGYTVGTCNWKPRFHVGFEFLSGDDPCTDDWEGWDPVMSRWPQWSELLGYRWAVETGMPFYWTNMHRYTIGVSAKPCKKMIVFLDHSLLRGDENQVGGLYSNGDTRGQLTVAKLVYAFNKRTSMHLWTEWFHPQSYYVGTADSALFIRGQFVFKF